MFISDYHTHTEYSHDSTVLIKDRVQWAINNGINEICITDHLELDTTISYHNIPDYKKILKEIESLRKTFGEKIKIKFGVEYGFVTSTFDEADKIISSNDFDFVIASTHAIDGIDLYFNSEYYKRDKINAYNYYFEHMLQNIKGYKNFNVYGHLDYIFRYSTYENNRLNYFDHKEVIDPVLKLLIENGKGIEVNLSGKPYGLDTFHPSLDILKAYKNFGGEIITIGSDTHNTQDVRELILQGQDIIKEAGFDYVTTFDKRKPNFIKI